MKKHKICFVMILLLVSVFLASCQMPYVNNGSATEPTTENNLPSATEKATEKVTEEATEKATEKATEADISGVSSNTAPKSANGYEICPVCTYVYKVGISCPSCNIIPDQYNVKAEVNCPTCGGGYEVGGVVPWRYCNICDDYFKVTDAPCFSCFSCGRTQLTPDDMSKQRECYCNDCITDTHCEICGIQLAKDEASSRNRKRCMGCSNCKFCGQYVRQEAYEYTGDFICFDCYDE